MNWHDRQLSLRVSLRNCCLTKFPGWGQQFSRRCAVVGGEFAERLGRLWFRFYLEPVGFARVEWRHVVDENGAARVKNWRRVVNHGCPVSGLLRHHPLVRRMLKRVGWIGRIGRIVRNGLRLLVAVSSAAMTMAVASGVVNPRRLRQHHWGADHHEQPRGLRHEHVAVICHGTGFVGLLNVSGHVDRLTGFTKFSTNALLLAQFSCRTSWGILCAKFKFIECQFLNNISLLLTLTSN